MRIDEVIKQCIQSDEDILWAQQDGHEAVAHRKGQTRAPHRAHDGVDDLEMPQIGQATVLAEAHTKAGEVRLSQGPSTHGDHPLCHWRRRAWDRPRSPCSCSSCNPSW